MISSLRLKPVYRKKAQTLLLVGFIVSVILLSFGVGRLPTANAATGNLLDTGRNWSLTCGATYVASLAGGNSVSQLAGNGLVMQIFETEQQVISSITDNVGNTWQKAVAYDTKDDRVEIWFSNPLVAGTITSVTVNFAGSVSVCTVIVQAFDSGALSFKSQWAAYQEDASVSVAQGAQNRATNAVPMTQNNLLIYSAVYNGTTASGSPIERVQLSTPMVLDSAGLTSPFGGAYTSSPYYLWSTTSQTVQPTFTLTLQATRTNVLEGVFGALFSSTGIFYKFTSHIQAIGCTEFSAAAVTVLTPHNTYYVLAQADPFGVSVLNASLVISSVTGSSAVIRLGVYVAAQANNSVVSSGNPFTRISQSGDITVPVTASKYLASYLPNVAVGGWKYLAIAVSQVSTNGTVSVRQATHSLTYYNDSSQIDLPASLTVAAAATSTTPPCLFGFMSNTAVVVQGTTTVTEGGTSFTTTLTTIDQNAALTTTTGYSIVMLVILLPAFALAGAMALTHSAQAVGIGFVAGMIIGAGLGNQAGLVPFWLVAVLIFAAIFIVVGIWKTGGSGGG